MAETETGLSLATDAARNLLHGLLPRDLDRIKLVLLSSAAMQEASPSMATKLLGSLDSSGISLPGPAALDISAACSGFIYGLKLAQDRVQSSPDDLVLLVTTETLTPVVDPADYSTSILFGDAASAVLVGEVSSLPDACYSLSSSVLGAKHDVVRSLVVPFPGRGEKLHMDGKRVFREAVRAMTTSILHACENAGLTIQELARVVPHQANQRILDAVAGSLGIPTDKIASNIRMRGNTSSSSIPLLLGDLESSREIMSGDLLCLVSFGAGYTYGAAIIQRL